MPSHPDRVRRNYDVQVDRVKARLLGEEVDAGQVRVEVGRNPHNKTRTITISISEKALQVARDAPALVMRTWEKFEQKIADLYRGLYERTPADQAVADQSWTKWYDHCADPSNMTAPQAAQLQQQIQPMPKNFAELKALKAQEDLQKIRERIVKDWHKMANDPNSWWRPIEPKSKP